ncbi:hypothetical protein [Dyadobacter aurulentus]|nr:hypothetical protein [Dyadobacter sp. UC 10]
MVERNKVALQVNGLQGAGMKGDQDNGGEMDLSYSTVYHIMGYHSEA